MDLFNREIVAYVVSRRTNSDMVEKMLHKACRKGTMLHSDQGVLYRTPGYRNLLSDHFMVQSM